jgi:hypothetical protein
LMDLQKSITLLIFSRIWLALATMLNTSVILHTEYLCDSGDPIPGFE